MPKIGVYAGSGTSHSWLWFVDLFENHGCHDLVFLDERLVRGGALENLTVLVMSGGDTFAVAAALGEAGAREIGAFVARGGVYIGSCAGAYLPMKSSKKPLDLFNFVDVKITNLSKILPRVNIVTCKFSTSYGCDFIFHPVREAVQLKAGNRTFDAPLYGGPGMTPADPSWMLAAYEDFTPKTLFLTDRELARDTLLGQGAVVRVPYGDGCFYLLGPHLEHPGYKEANQFVIDAMVTATARPDGGAGINGNRPAPDADALETVTGKKARQHLLPVKRELSNSRITAGALEFVPVQWHIGKKVYEPQKIRVYLESIWKRVRPLEKQKILVVNPRIYDRLVSASARMTVELRKVRRQIDENQESLDTAVVIFDLLHVLAVSFFELYFDTMFNRKGLPPGRKPRKREMSRRPNRAVMT